jgi:peptidoglycan-associated lipoprotein
MKNICTLLLIGTLLVAGCAKKTAIEAPQPAAAETSATTPLVSAPIGEAAPSAPASKTEGGENLHKIFFDFDSFLLTQPSKEKLQKNARVLQAQPEIRITIEGHTDERGSSTYNLALGEKRAQAARAYLQNLGIAAERIRVVSYGEEKPAQEGQSEEAWAQNRRAEFVTAN